MLLESVQIRNFRNVALMDWKPAAGLNLIVGDNGAGKTNILEAIHLGIMGRSFRTRREDECLPWSRGEGPSDVTRTDVEIRGRTGPGRQRAALAPGSKRVLRDGAVVERLGDLLEQGSVVVFTPDDVDLFRDAPAERRRVFDQNLCQASSAYLAQLRRNQRAVKEVNALLRGASGRGEAETLRQAEVYYRILAESGAVLVRERARFAQSLSEMCGRVHTELGGAGELTLRYDCTLFRAERDRAARFEPPADPGAEAILARLHQMHADSLRRGSVDSGPHRDDLRAELAGRDLGRYGSQGQQRLCALTLRLSTARLMREQLNDPPMVLLDDFGSELDQQRRESVLRGLRGGFQTIVTAARLEDFTAPELFDSILRVTDGRAEPA